MEKMTGPGQKSTKDDLIYTKLDTIRDKLAPYQRIIMIGGFVILIFLVVYLGYARGSLDVCNDLGGRLEVGWTINCRPGSCRTPIDTKDAVGQSFFIPDIIIDDGT